jgi:hypothetical protein
VSGRGNPRNRNGAARRAVVAWLRSQGRGCWICRAFGRDPTIDYSLPAGDPMSFECDELVPVSKGGDPYDPANVDAAHRRCNQWRGNKSVAEVMAIARGRERRRKPVITSRKWF